MAPAVSVIVPAWNTRAWIGEALASLTRQTFADFEAVVVDDASTDGTAEVVEACGDPRVRLIRMPVNGGAAIARNTALAHARGQWIALLDSDDWYGPRRLERLVGEAERLDADLVADDILYVRDGETAPWSSLFARSGATFTQPEWIDAARFVATDVYAGRGLQLGLSKPLMRAAFLREKGLRYQPELRLGQDYWLYLDCLVRGARFALIPEGHYHYRARPGSLVRQSQAVRLDGYCRAGDAFLRRDDVQADRALVAAMRRHLANVRAWRAYYRVVEPLKRREWTAAAAAAARNPGFVSRALRRAGGAALRRVGAAAPVSDAA
ncbi:MAG TPA: glycosyltransferase family 2 protein [Planctomycetota bacterium]|nr:glycosyltransferase family 2 protein [Planctomycetota bacterium]